LSVFERRARRKNKEEGLKERESLFLLTRVFFEEFSEGQTMSNQVGGCRMEREGKRKRRRGERTGKGKKEKEKSSLGRE